MLFAFYTLSFWSCFTNRHVTLPYFRSASSFHIERNPRFGTSLHLNISASLASSRIFPLLSWCVYSRSFDSHISVLPSWFFGQNHEVIHARAEVFVQKNSLHFFVWGLFSCPPRLFPLRRNESFLSSIWQSFSRIFLN